MKPLPCQECKGRCCTYPVFSQSEYDLVRMIHKIPEGAIVRPFEHAVNYDPFTNKPGSIGYVIHKPGGTCPYLKDGGCSIYNTRPKVCRDYGVVEALPCEYLEPARAKKLMKDRMRMSK